MPTESWTLEHIVDNLDRSRWDWPGPVTYSFFETLPAEFQGEGNEVYAGFSALPADQRDAVALIFSMISEIANLTFVEAADNGATAERMTFGASSDLLDYTWGSASTGGSWGGEERGDITNSTIWLNTDYATGSFGAGTYNLTALLHEIMHGLGVAHPGAYNANGDPITYANNAEYIEDSRQYTVMSYFEASVTGAGHSGLYASTPLLHDIAVLQHLYGVNTTTRAGDTVYGFNSNAGGQYAFTADTRSVIALWDAGGVDTIDFSGFTSHNRIDLTQGGFSSFNGLTFNMAIAYGAVIENAIGGSGNDKLIGNDAINVLSGGLGSDGYHVQNTGDVVIEADSSDFDIIISTVSYTIAEDCFVEEVRLTGSANINATGSSRDDILSGNDGINILTGGGGDDLYFVQNTEDVIVELNGEGVDRVYATCSFTLRAGSYVEELYFQNTTASVVGVGNALDNKILGTQFHDTLDGGEGADLLVGGSGNDTYIVDLDDRVIENDLTGNDTIVAGFSYSLQTFQYIENVRLTGTANLNATGNAAANILTGNAGVNVLTGGAGNDAYYVQNTTDSIVEATDAGTDTVFSSVDFVLRPGVYVENLTLTGTADINGTGNGLDNILTGNAGLNTLAGGKGDDTYYVQNTGDILLEAKGQGDDTASSTATFTLAAGVYVDNLTLTGSANIDGTGNGLSNIIRGNNGINVLTGGKGDDTYYVQNTGDTVVETKGQGTDTVYSSVSFSLMAGSYVENLTLTGFLVANASGNGLGNVINGNSNANSIDGGAGNDILYGRGGDDILSGGNSGADLMYGGSGDDTFYVNSSGDVADENSSNGTDHVYSSVNYSLNNQYVEYLTLTGSADIYAKGNSLDNRLVGNDGDNRINGMQGQDRLTGGAGSDTFIWDATDHSKVHNSDRIVDLTNEDFIDLSRIDADVVTTGTQQFVLVDAFTETAGQMMLTYDASTQVTSLNADTNGDGLSDMLVRMDGNHEDFDNFIFGGG